ncbi:MAG: hypothetical protein LBL62_09155, partial [Planctomycetaceae bacterium]|nr:hypothetical protein [Planctomycetaceae bacterium]
LTQYIYTQAVLKFMKLITEAQQREAVTRGRSLLPYRLRYSKRSPTQSDIFFQPERAIVLETVAFIL